MLSSFPFAGAAPSLAFALARGRSTHGPCCGRENAVGRSRSVAQDGLRSSVGQATRESVARVGRRVGAASLLVRARQETHGAEGQERRRRCREVARPGPKGSDHCRVVVRSFQWAAPGRWVGRVSDGPVGRGLCQGLFGCALGRHSGETVGLPGFEITGHRALCLQGGRRRAERARGFEDSEPC